MVKHADLLICDSKNIEKYIREDYKQYSPNTTFIAYGTDDYYGVADQLLRFMQTINSDNTDQLIPIGLINIYTYIYKVGFYSNI